MKIKPKTQTKHREGTLVAFIDLVQELVGLRYSSKEMTEEQKDFKQDEIIRKIRRLDITTIGDLYLTSGGRVVLDKGHGEYFNESDKKLFTLKELKAGIQFKDFQKKINNVKLGENDG